MNKDELIDYCKEAGQTISELDYKNRILEKENKKLNGAIQTYDILLKSNIEENKQLNKQLKDKTEDYRRMKDNFDSKVDVLTKIATQQKEFIKYLEDKIYSIEPKGTGINYNCEYDSEEDYVMAMQEQSRLNTLKEILQKYKEIIGGKDEK